MTGYILSFGTEYPNIIFDLLFKSRMEAILKMNELDGKQLGKRNLVYRIDEIRVPKDFFDKTT